MEYKDCILIFSEIKFSKKFKKRRNPKNKIITKNKNNVIIIV